MSTTSGGTNPFRAVLDVGTALVSTTALEDGLAQVAQKIGEAMMAWSVDIQQYDAERDILVYEAYWCAGGVTADDLAYRGTVTNVWERPQWRKVLGAGQVIQQCLDDPGIAPEERAKMEEWGTKTTLDAPLRVGDQVIGVLGIAETRFVRRFSTMEIDLFGQLCDLAASAINNAKLFRRQQERERHLRSLLDASRTLTATLDLDEVLARVATEACEALRAAQASVYEYDAEGETIVYRAMYDRASGLSGHDAIGTIYRLAEHPGDADIVHGDEVVVENVSDAALPADRRASMEAFNEKTCLSVPLRFGERPLGILRLYEFGAERRFTPDEVELARGLGEQAAVAVRNARLYLEREQQRRHLDALLAAAQAMTSSVSSADVFRSIAEVSATALGSPRCLIYEFDAVHDTLTPRAVIDATAMPGYDTTGVAEALADLPGCGKALFSGELVVEQVSDPALPEDVRSELARWGETTCLNVPLVFRDRPLGLLILSEVERERDFSAAELELARGVAEAAAVALRNAQLAAALERAGGGPHV